MEIQDTVGGQIVGALEYLLGQAGSTLDDLLGPDSLQEPAPLLVLGCSSSEVAGGQIGKASNPALGEKIVRALNDACKARGVWLAVQCCEHLNRALVVPGRVARARGLTRVSAVPYPKAGGSCASAYYRMLEDPVLVESIGAELGMDVGDTLIGMHLLPVAVPVRGPIRRIGGANLTMAYSRPRLIGGERARYELGL